VLTGGGDIREVQVDFPRLLAIPAFDRIAGLSNRHLNYKCEYTNANDLEVRLRALTDFAKH